MTAVAVYDQFIDLADTPGSYTGQAGQTLVVTPAETGLAFAPAGGGGTGDLTYVHTQIGAASTWVVTHNLGKYPAIQIFDSANDEVMGDVRHTDVNTATLTFGAAFSGTATCN